MSVERAMRRISSPEWWKHLRPRNKRIAHKFVRALYRRALKRSAETP